MEAIPAETFTNARRLFLQRVPVAVVLAVARAAHPRWWTWHGQDRFIRDVLRCDAVRQWPVEASYAAAVTRAFARASEAEALAQRPNNDSDAAGDGADGEDEDDDVWELHDDLLALVGGPSASARLGGAKGAAEEGEEEGFFFKTYEIPIFSAVHVTGVADAAVTLPMRVGPQFRNVGMSLWPAAFALVNFVLDELLAPTASIASTAKPSADDVALLFGAEAEAAEGRPVRILELGWPHMDEGQRHEAAAWCRAAVAEPA